MLFLGSNSSIKQADAILLTYPLAWNMSVDIMRNDLISYETPVTTARTPAMTHSWFTVGFKWVEEEAKTNEYFIKSYQDYMVMPFRVRMISYPIIYYDDTYIHLS